MYLDSIIIKNYKSLRDTGRISLAIPKEGSETTGLTIFVGENNSGKSSVFSAIKKIGNKQQIDDEERFNIKEDFEISFESSGAVTKYSSKVDNSLVQQSSTSGQVTINNFEIVNSTRTWTANIANPELNEEQYKVQYDRKDHRAVDSVLASRLASIKGTPEEGELTDILNTIVDCKSWGIRTVRGQTYLSYEATSKREPVDIGFALGDGVLNLFRIAYALIQKNKMVFLDEPEAFLHPRAQIQLAKVISEIAKEKQIVVSTHSPYMLEGANIHNGEILHFKLNKDGATQIAPITIPEDADFSVIAYKVYGTNGEQYHNFLYEKLKEGEEEQKRAAGNPDFGFNNHTSFSSHLTEKHAYLKKTYPNTAKKDNPLEVILPVFIRSCIHYPQNKELISETNTFSELLDESIVLLERLNGYGN